MYISKLKELRKEKKLTVADICREADITPYWYYMVENGVKTSEQTKAKIAKVFDVPVNELFSEDTKKE